MPPAPPLPSPYPAPIMKLSPILIHDTPQWPAIEAKLLTLPDATNVYCGHEYTISNLVRRLPFGSQHLNLP